MKQTKESARVFEEHQVNLAEQESQAQEPLYSLAGLIFIGVCFAAGLVLIGLGLWLAY